MRTFDTLGKKKVVIGMIHLKPMPGTPHYQEGDFEKSLSKAVADARALYDGGADGCLIQTVDKVYPAKDEADYTRVAGMAAIVHAVAQETGPEFQIGVQIMWNALTASAAVAKVAGASFQRCTALVGTSMSPFGLVEANPYEFLKFRRSIGAEHIKLVAEVSGMHFHWYGEDKPVADVARSAVMVGAHAVEIANPDEETSNHLIREIKKANPGLPVILGGYTNHENAARRLAEADGAFVGTCLEKGKWGSEIDVDKVRAYVDIVRNLEK